MPPTASTPGGSGAAGPRHLPRELNGHLEEGVEDVVEGLVGRLRDYLASLQVPTDTDELFILVLRGLDEAIQQVARLLTLSKPCLGEEGME